MNPWSQIAETLDIRFITRVYAAQQLTLAGAWNTVSRVVVATHIKALGEVAK